MLEISAPKFSVDVNLTPDSKEQSNILSNANSGVVVKIGLGWCYYYQFCLVESLVLFSQPL